MNTPPKKKSNPYRLGLGLVVLTILLAAVLQVYRDRGGEDRVPWMSDFATALGAAQATNKPILANFTADWCPPCQDMNRLTYSRPEVAQAIDDGFVPLKIDLTNPDHDQEALALRYDVRAIPTRVVIDRDGNPIATSSGDLRAPAFLDWLERYGHRSPNAVGSSGGTEPELLAKELSP